MSFCGLTKRITPKICWFCLVVINNILLNLLCVWILFAERSSVNLADLHWFPASHKKMPTVSDNAISGSAPPYLADLLQLCTPSRSLRSSADSRIFRIPIRCRIVQSSRAFLRLALPSAVASVFVFVFVCHAQTLSSF